MSGRSCGVALTWTTLPTALDEAATASPVVLRGGKLHAPVCVITSPSVLCDDIEVLDDDDHVRPGSGLPPHIMRRVDAALKVALALT